MIVFTVPYLLVSWKYTILISCYTQIEKIFPLRKVFVFFSWNHRIIEWLRLERTLNIIIVQSHCIFCVLGWFSNKEEELCNGTIYLFDSFLLIFLLPWPISISVNEIEVSDVWKKMKNWISSPQSREENITCKLSEYSHSTGLGT